MFRVASLELQVSTVSSVWPFSEEIDAIVPESIKISDMSSDTIVFQFHLQGLCALNDLHGV